MDLLTIGDQSIPYVFMEKPWIRNSYLRFDDEKLIVTARNFDSATKLVNTHKEWIVKHYYEIKASMKLFSSNSILFNGGKYEAAYVPSNARTRMEIAQNKITVHSKSTQVAERSIDKWLAFQTVLFTDVIAAEKASMIQKERPATKARRLGKWGYCKSDSTITFNSYICMLPADIRDYIISHEVAHLRQMNHSRKFWEVVSQLCPNYKQLRRRLKNYDNTRRKVL